MEIEMDSVNELKKLLSCWDEELLTEKLKKYPYLFDKSQKTYKERDNFLKNFPYPKFWLFSRLEY